MIIDIGDAAEVRGNQWSLGSYTTINAGNPANANGIITQVEIFAVADHDLENVVVGTFYLTGENQLKCRAAEAIGAVAGGAKRTFPGLSIAVETGDFIGIYYTAGWLYRATAGFTNIWYIAGQEIDPNDEAVYTNTPDDAISLYGEGEELASGAGDKSANMGPKVVAAGFI